MHRPWLLSLAILLAPPAEAATRSQRREQRKAVAAYEGARHAYYALKADSKRRQFRHQWLGAIDRFEAVARAHPGFDKAPEALYTSAELLADLSQISMLPEDLQRAVTDYRQVFEKHPKHRLADDAALMLGRVYAQRLDEPEHAEQVLGQALSKLPLGDREKEIRALRGQLQASLEKSKRTKPAERVAEKPADKTPEKSPERSPEKSAERIPEKVADKSPDKTAEKAPEKSADRSPEKSTERGTEKVAEKSPDKSTDKPADRASTKVAEKGPPAGSATLEAIARLVQMREQQSRTRGSTEATPESEPSSGSLLGPTIQAAGPAAPTSAPVVAAAAPPSSPPRESRPTPSGPPSMSLRNLQAGRDKDITIAEQLGLKVRRVVIDAGHGGHDPGAVGPTGAEEKDVALSIAMKLGSVLEAQGLEVVYTRRDDTFLPLEKRAKLANEARGDLFISIHCNSSPSRRLHGIETYSLNIAADRYSIRLAARENSSSEKGISDLQFILADLATKANTEESQRLAQRVQSELHGDLSSKYSNVANLGTKQALFYVLLGAKMPAILVETSFVSNPEEERRLKSAEYQADVAQAIASGVSEFLGNRGRLAKASDTE